MNTNPTPPHIGTLLKTFFRARRTRKSVLARLMQRKASAISNYQHRDSLQTKILWELCIHLQHNFFTDLAAQLPAHFSTDSPIDTSKDELINTLQEENKQLTTQVKTLKEVVSKK